MAENLQHCGSYKRKKNNERNIPEMFVQTNRRIGEPEGRGSKIAVVVEGSAKF